MTAAAIAFSGCLDAPSESPVTPGEPATADTQRPAAPSAEIRELATSGPGSRAAAIERDGLPPAGYIARERPRALAVAREFLDGYLAFEVRQGGETAVRKVAQTATASLAADLLAGGAQLPAAMDRLPPRAEVYAIDIEFDKPPTAAQVRGEVRRGSDLSDIGVILERKGTRWVVVQITQ